MMPPSAESTEHPIARRRAVFGWSQAELARRAGDAAWGVGRPRLGLGQRDSCTADAGIRDKAILGDPTLSF